MRYASIRNMDISNGEGIGVALFVQGCHFHCKNCFNQNTWDFNGGKEWTKKTSKDFLKLINKDFIKRVSILGGEPLANENLTDILKLTDSIRDKFPNKSIWLYTGYDMSNIFCKGDELNSDDYIRGMIAKNCDIIVDGPFIDELKDFNLKFRGSSNQTIIDVKQSFKEKTKIEYII